MSAAERDEIRSIIAKLEESLKSYHGKAHTDAIKQAVIDLRELLVKG